MDRARAAVRSGTLYRHFAIRGVPFEAVYRPAAQLQMQQHMSLSDPVETR